MSDPCDHQNAFFFESPDFWFNQGRQGQDRLILREKATLRDFFLLLLICFHLVILGGGAGGEVWNTDVQWGPDRGQISHIEGVLLQELIQVYDFLWRESVEEFLSPLEKTLPEDIHLSVGFPTQGHPTRLGHDVPVARSPVFQHTAWAFPSTSYVQAPILAFLH